MMTQLYTKTKPAVSLIPANTMLLQRKWNCSKTSGCSGKETKLVGPKHTPQYHSGHNLSRTGIQAKLTIGAPDDIFEREADAIARVVTEHGIDMKNGTTNPLNHSGGIASVVQRKEKEPEVDEAEGEEATEEKLKEMEESNGGPLIQRKVEPGAGSKKDGMMAVLNAAGGNPLEPQTRYFMESRFGYDFSNIRIHTDEHSDRAAGTIHARAFTAGNDIWFARGEYSPDSPSGRRLLAHELVHTIQQGSAARSIQRSICPGSCASPVSRGKLCRRKKVVRDNCGERDTEDPDNKISHIRVTLGDRKVTLFWNGTPRKADGTPEEFGCTPNSGRTPKGWDTVGTKCGINHTSYERYNMAWFTAFRSTGMDVGFHDSQPLGSGYQSHGCVRVSCEAAEKINKNSKSGWTSIVVR